MAMEKGESASGINGNVGVVGCMIVEDVPIHARIVVTWARVKIAVQGKIVEECQHNDNSNVQHTHMYSICPFFLLLKHTADWFDKQMHKIVGWEWWCRCCC